MKQERPPGPRWRLKKTLARRVEVRVIEPDDMKYLWAAYKKGALASMGPVFENTDMTAEQFRQTFDVAAEHCADAWTVTAESRAGYRPIGVIFGAFAPLRTYMIVIGGVWFPWATRRNVIEGTVAFLNMIRKQMPMILYAKDEHKRLYEVCCMHGILRRIGTSFVIYPGQAAAAYETRAMDK